jgi:hypothetical protein
MGEVQLVKNYFQSQEKWGQIRVSDSFVDWKESKPMGRELSEDRTSLVSKCNVKPVFAQNKIFWLILGQEGC